MVTRGILQENDDDGMWERDYFIFSLLPQKCTQYESILTFKGDFYTVSQAQPVFKTDYFASFLIMEK